MESPRKVGWTARRNTTVGRAGRGTCRSGLNLRREREPGAWLPLPFLLFPSGVCPASWAMLRAAPSRRRGRGRGVTGAVCWDCFARRAPPAPIQDGEKQGGGGLICGPRREAGLGHLQGERGAQRDPAFFRINILRSGSYVSHPWTHSGLETPLKKHLDLF